MATTFKEKVSAGFARAGQETKKKLDKTEAASTYERIDNLGDLAYKDLITAEEVHPEFLPSMKGPQGDQGFGFYGGYVTLNATLAQWKVYGTVGSTFAWTCDTTNIREGDYGIVTGRVTDLGHTGAQIIYKVTAKTNTGVNGITIGFLCGEKGYHFTPSVDGKGNLSWTNDGGLTNPATQNIRGYHFTPSVDGVGNLSWTNNGELENPATQNIRGYHFTPFVDENSNLSWTNNGQMENPPTRNIRGWHFTPSVDNDGNLSWTNNGGMTNPATKNIRGPRGFHFTPSVSDEGVISWTNNGGLSNPTSVDIRGRGVYQVEPIQQQISQADWLNIFVLELYPLEVKDNSFLKVGDIALVYARVDDGEKLQNACLFARVSSIGNTSNSDGTITHKIYVKAVGAFTSGKDGLDGQDGKDGAKGDRGPRGSSLFPVVAAGTGWNLTHEQWEKFVYGLEVTFTADLMENDFNADDIVVFTGTVSDIDDGEVTVFARIKGIKMLESNKAQLTLSVVSKVYSSLRGPRGYDGATFTPSVDSLGNLSWSNNAGLENPATVNIKGKDGTIYFPEMDEDGNLTWTVYGDYPIAEPVNLKGPKGDTGSAGATFTPSVSSSGVLSWTNNAGLANPSSVNIKGPSGNDGANGNDGATFTPSVSPSGVLSWSNNAGLANPASVNIKGPKGDTGPAGPSGGVQTVNGISPDANGNIQIEVGSSGGGGSGDGIPRTGDRGVLAGFEKFEHGVADWSDMEAMFGSVKTINASSSDVFFAVGPVVVENGTPDNAVKTLLGAHSDPLASEFSSWTKVVVCFSEPIIMLDSRWLWAGGDAPVLEAGCVLVLHWNTDFGVASAINITGDQFEQLIGAILSE